jgi:hypothetical protein
MVVMDLPNKILLNIVQKQHSDPIHTFFIEVEAIILCRIRICEVHATYQPVETAKICKDEKQYVLYVNYVEYVEHPSFRIHDLIFWLAYA